ncbi:MAG: DKNYY domain-containing protein [Chitinophagaceae bacterium]|nr:DKNYY domain-containing protein [Rubrivivax sp.]
MSCLRQLLPTLLAALVFLAGCDNGGDYNRKGGRWHFDDLPMQVADPASFKPLGRYFARDQQRGYYRDMQIEGSDGAAFEALSAHAAKDSRRVYWADTHRKGQEYWAYQHLRVRVVAGADPASYQALPHDHGRDARSAFHEGHAFTVRDPASFEVLDASFTRDKQRGYYERKEIAGSDGASFELIDAREGHYARDRQHVFHTVPGTKKPDGSGLSPPAVRVLRGANPATLQVLSRGYARDGARVWWMGQPMAGVDADSFTVTDDYTQEHDAQDARNTYRQGARQGVAAASSSRVRR